MEVFCIGYNKTGTTSLRYLFGLLGANVARQRPFEELIPEYLDGNLDIIIETIEHFRSNFCFYQDVPFSLPGFYLNLLERYPDAKFILTTRDSANQWYESLVRYHKNKFSNKENHKAYRNRIRRILTDCYGAPNDSPYDKYSLINSYNKHIQSAIKDIPSKRLLQIKLSHKNDLQKVLDFIDFKDTINLENFPHMNKKELNT